MQGVQGATPIPVGQEPQPEYNQPQGPSVDKFIEQVNIAEHMDEKKLDQIGSDVYDGYMLDLRSKQAWDNQVDSWVKLAAQVTEEKSFPWPKASNVKYPLLATSAMQFAARAYPSLVPADGKIVQFKVVGADPQGMKAAKADKLAKHMNYQLLEDMEDWEEEMDRLLVMLPIVGCLFKKTYFDPIKKKNCSKLIGTKDLVVNYWASSLEAAHRKTEIIPMTKNQIIGAINAGIYCDIDLPEPKSQPELPRKIDVHGNVIPSQADDTTPYVVLEQHGFLDLDDDGYQEPYVITIEESTKKVLRIVARFDSDGVYMSDDKKIYCIEPVEYYTKYEFIPNPDGGFYGIGFGHLLGPINESTNTLINQLVDAGTLANLQAGFIGKGLKIKMGQAPFQPGEWRPVNITGDDLKKQILPLPIKEPSDVLFKLMGLLIQSGKELASISEIFTGKMPGQNTPATTTQATIEQGMKVFTSIYKRIYRSFAKEFKKLFRLNSLYDENFAKAQLILDEPISKEDYDTHSYDVCPTADPTAVSTTQKMEKAAQLMQLLPLGTINPLEATKRILEGQEQPNIAALMQQPQQQQDPKVMQVQAQMQMKQEEHQIDMAMKQFELQMKAREAEMDQKFMQMEKMMEMRLKEMEFNQKAQHQQRQAVIDAAIGQQEMAQAQQQHQLTSQMVEEKHQMGMKQMKEKANATRNAREVAGMAKSFSNGSNKRGN